MEQVPLWVSLAQIGASVFLALAALAVASVSAFWSYRNNFGWKPGILIRSCAYYERKPGQLALMLTFEVWNRFKYPIMLQAASVRFHQLNLDMKSVPLISNKEADYAPSNTLLCGVEEALGPNSAASYNLDVTYIFENAQAPKSDVTIEGQYYDPRSIRVRRVRLLYHIGGPGRPAVHTHS